LTITDRAHALREQWSGPHIGIAQLSPHATSDYNHDMNVAGAIPPEVSTLYGAGDGELPRPARAHTPAC